MIYLNRFLNSIYISNVFKRLLVALVFNFIVMTLLVFLLNAGVIVFVGAFLLQLFAFSILLVLALIFKRIMKPYHQYVFFFLGYCGLLFAIWRINDSPQNNFLLNLHGSKDFWIILFPFLISNLSLYLLSFIIKKFNNPLTE
ncbi:hypothetical protein OB69_14925 [Roseivirga seohaensis subsp. aquiponti]|uniref:Uncharacterized protein n=1 Tax=Roseivirga seohaensis subsp. aquiponti TaxID=1566026 RepID=A0A0L8AIM1_9BACT|nr:hypothetical protein OB69_14925 [Roseivirga seohaensis subsp. aquiponti]